MSKSRASWSDAEMLEALRLRDLGLTNAQIGLRLGRSSLSVKGILIRIADDLAASEAA